MAGYVPRLADGQLASALRRVGAVVIEGPKACGKTETALQTAASVVRMDTDPQVATMMEVDPGLVLGGDSPRLIDEWQVHPSIWDQVRRRVDESREVGQFLLTGSTAPAEEQSRHSGAGRFARLRMRTMSLLETEDSSGKASLSAICRGEPVAVGPGPLPDVRALLERVARGGWPADLGLSVEDALANRADYVETIAAVDIRTPDGTRRNPQRVLALLKALARSNGTEVSLQTLAADAGITRDAVRDYLDALARIFITEDQPAWAGHLRSSATLRSTPKRHLADPSLAVAALGASPNSLLRDLEYAGQLVESQAVHDLRIYTAAERANITHGRTSRDQEVDAVVEYPDGRWALIEVKLGARREVVDAAADSLRAFADQISLRGRTAPQLIVLTGTGPAMTRADGVHQVSLTTLGP